MKGAWASRASRRAISVLPQPVGPIIRMFLGRTSSRKDSSSCWRRQRLRRAMATALLGRLLADDETVELGDDLARGEGGHRLVRVSMIREFVGVDADLGGDPHRLAGDVLGREPVDVDQSPGRGQRVGAARADADQAVLGLEHVAGAGQHQGRLGVGHGHHRLEPAQIAVGAPVLGELDAGARQLARMALELGLEPLEQREGIGGAAGEAGEDAAVAEPPDLAGVALDDGRR